MFLLLPAFALLLKALYPGRLYTAHLVFALHFHAFAFLVLPLDALIDARISSMGSPGDLGPLAIAGMIVAGVVQLWVIVYLGTALRRVYGGSRPATGLKTIVLFFGYLLVLVIVGVLAVPGLRSLIISRVLAG